MVQIINNLYRGYPYQGRGCDMDHLAGILLLALPSGADDAAVPAVFYAIQPVGGPWGGQYPCP